MRWLIAFLAVALLAVPVAVPQEEAEPLLTDDRGDVTLSLYDQSTNMPGGWDAVDLVHLSMVEYPETMRVVLGVAGFPDCQGNACNNAGDTRTYFRYGEKRYEIQLGISLNGFPYAQFWEVIAGDFNRQMLARLDNQADPESATYTVDIPRNLITDENGSPPRKETRFTDIYTRAYSQISFGGPNPNDPTDPAGTDMLVTSDTMGLDAPAELALTMGGSSNNGPVRLTSDNPYRASNGGAATYRFDLKAIQTGDTEALYELQFEGIPDSWTLATPDGRLRLPPNAAAEFSIVIETPFGHQHGGSDAFQARIVEVDGDSWAEVELGIHYVTVPQPSGHHPTLWFHSQGFPEPFGTFNTALGGINGLLSMNTLDADPDDEQVNVQGSTGFVFNNQFRWWICLEPELLMGIDMNMSQTGTLVFPMTSVRPFEGSVLTGRLLHLAPGDEIEACIPSEYDGRSATPIAEIEATNPFTVSGSTSVEATVVPLDAGDYIPFQAGSTLVLEVMVDGGDMAAGFGPSGPGGMELVPGGSITLPLDEYHDARPAGVVGWNEAAPDLEDDPLDADGFEQEAVRDTPAPGVLLVGLALALVRRR